MLALLTQRFADEITLPEINYLVNVEEVLEALLAREDTNKDYKITILDEGSKVSVATHVTH